MFENPAQRVDAVEECYEFMLAYAAQGIAGDEETQSLVQVRQLLRRAIDAINGIPEAYRAAVREQGLEPADRYEAFISVLERDAANSAAIMELVLAQSRLSSQLVDNLNASIHLRALLTDLFVADEIWKLQAATAADAA